MQHTPLPADFTLSSLQRHPVERRAVVVDTDGGCDDALALLLLLADPTIDVVAVTITYGNVSLQQATYNIQHLLHVLKREDVPVYQGAAHALLHSDSHADIVTWEGHGKDGFGDVDWTVAPFNTRPLLIHRQHQASNNATSPQPPASVGREHAACILSKLAKQYAEDTHSAGLDLVALGPLTNIALAQRLDPMFIPHLHHIHCMAGSATNKGNASYTAEFNAHCDPEALSILLNAVTDPAKLYLYDFDVCDSAGLTWQEFDQLMQVHPGTPHTHFIQHTSEAYRKYVKGDGTFVACDAYASAGYLHPSAMIKQQQAVRCCVELQGIHTRGALAIDWYNSDNKPANMTLVTGYDKESFMRLLQATTAAEEKQPVRQRAADIQAILDKHSGSDRLRNNNIHLRLMRPSDASEVSTLCSYTFAHYEPLSVRLAEQSTSKKLAIMTQMQQWLGSSLGHDAIYQTSVVAVARSPTSSAEAIVGLAYTHPQALQEAEPRDMSEMAVAPIMELITKLNQSFMASYRQQPRNLLWFSMLSVDAKHSSCGIGTTLVKAVVELAQLYGYDDVACDATSASQNCFTAADFRSVDSAPYDKFLFQGQAIFSNIPPFSKPFPTPAAHLMHIKLHPAHKHPVTLPTPPRAAAAEQSEFAPPLTTSSTTNKALQSLLANYNQQINEALKTDSTLR